ncbi:MBL fold metallo-hydrolase [Nocardioides sp. InS609-2]|uniref:MBL fold metallo-hydrolase n=1 Tax=Nocardioides sp. InS609-2 TaxID=2760705 RepID=UPI0017A99DD7|nr:MBL fold metallo-hydrolase [Nocardioides sp. InS609-2]MBA3781795.1 MBL fold metallo-hydrolase [Nocardioides sp.]
MDSRLVVLGSSGAWPGAGHACSGYVLEHRGFRVVLDFGYGTVGPLLTLLDSHAGDGVDAVVVSHAHADHMGDLHAFYRARWFGARTAPPIPAFAPPQVRDQLWAVESIDGPDDGAIDRVFTWHKLPAAEYTVGPWRLESADLPHYVPNAGVRLVSDDLVVAYTGDTGPSPVLAELGRDADLFIVECTDYTQLAEPKKEQLHLNARTAAEAARDAGAKRLLLTHFWPGVDRERTARDVAEIYDGEVLVAREGLVVGL